MGALLTSTDSSADAREGEPPDRPSLDGLDPRDSGAPSETSHRLPRWALPLATIFALAPLISSAIRNGLAHWTPTWDAATTTVRVNDVISRHPPLIGMAAFPSRFADSLYSFPGAFELYLLAPVVRLLGPTWGVLLGMAAINGCWVLLTIWLVRRRAGDLAAVIACLVIATLLWSAGSQVIVDLTPMQIEVVSFLLLLVAAWSVADGDAPAVLVLAIVGNYLVLDQLKFTLTAPTIGVFAFTARHFTLQRIRAAQPERWPEERTRQIRWLTSGLVFTVVIWLPPLIQQFTSPNGNLSSLVRGSTGQLTNGQGTGLPHTLMGAFSALVATTVVPPLWLRPTFHQPSFDAGGGGIPFLVGAACFGAVVGFCTLLWVLARRRGDRTVTTALATVLVAWLASLVTTRLTPDQDGYTPMYLHSLWPLSVFLWLVVVVATLRTWPVLARVLRRPAPAGALVSSVAVIALLSVPLANFGAGTPDGTVDAARSLDPQIRAAMRGSGPVLLRTDSDVARRLLPTVMLDLQEVGVEFRVERAFDIQQFGDHRKFDPEDISADDVLLLSLDGRTPVGYEKIAEARPLWVIDADRFARYDHRVRSFLSDQTELRVADGVSAEPTRIDQVQATLTTSLREASETGTDVADVPALVKVLAQTADGDGHAWLDIPGMTSQDVQSWARAKLGGQGAVISIFRAPIAVPLAGPVVRGDP